VDHRNNRPGELRPKEGRKNSGEKKDDPRDFLPGFMVWGGVRDTRRAELNIAGYGVSEKKGAIKGGKGAQDLLSCLGGSYCPKRINLI